MGAINCKLNRGVLCNDVAGEVFLLIWNEQDQQWELRPEKLVWKEMRRCVRPDAPWADIT